MITDVAEGTRMDTKKTIMVVDDNPDIITIVKTILEGRGYSVFSASSGLELLNMLSDQKPDLIILDIMMPEMDGLEVLTRLKSKSETATIPVILLTAKVQYEDVLGGYKLGADYYITKPFTSTQLVNGINLLLGEGKPQ
jgi:CheY-like chemotaxis protein